MDGCVLRWMDAWMIIIEMMKMDKINASYCRLSHSYVGF